MARNGDACRNRRQVEGFADEVAQRHHQFGGGHGAAFGQFVGGMRGQAHLLVGAEQHDVGEGRFNGIAYAAGTVAAGTDREVQAFVAVCFELPQVAQVARVHVQCPGE